MEAKDLNPKANLLLGAGLDVLHFESREWVAKIDFWKDEVQFFEKLLKRKNSEDNLKQNYTSVLQNLDKIHGNLFQDLGESIKEHERLLASLDKKSKGLSDSIYREKHKKLTKRLIGFENDFKTFKKIVFDHVKNL